VIENVNLSLKHKLLLQSCSDSFAAVRSSILQLQPSVQNAFAELQEETKRTHAKAFPVPLQQNSNFLWFLDMLNFLLY